MADQRAMLRCWLIFCLLTLCTADPPKKSCTKFFFPSLNTSEVTAKEESILTLPFKFQNFTCIAEEDFSITVKKLDKDSMTFVDYCKVNLSKGKCVTAGQDDCGCPKEKYLYQVTKTMERSDNTTWLWTTSINGRVEDVQLTFNVMYAAQVTDLTLNTNASIVENGTELNVVCLWDPGNPPVTARLLDRHGVEMEGSNYSKGQIQYRFPAVGCQDAGLIRCEAPGASHNLNKSLLVRSKPVFQSGDRVPRETVVSGERAELRVPVCSHTTNISKCRIVPLSLRKEMNLACDSYIALTGTPPDLTLTVQMDNVRKEEEGRWRLELTNDEGTGHFTFILDITENGATAGPVTAAVVSVIVIIAISIGVVYVWRGRKRYAVRHALHVLHLDRLTFRPITDAVRRARESLTQAGQRFRRLASSRSVRQDEEGAGKTDSRRHSDASNLYWEITDDNRRSEMCPDEDPPKPCKRACLRPKQDKPEPKTSGLETESAGASSEPNPMQLVASRHDRDLPGPPKPPRLSSIIADDCLPPRESLVDVHEEADDVGDNYQEAADAGDDYLTPKASLTDEKASGVSRAGHDSSEQLPRSSSSAEDEREQGDFDAEYAPLSPRTASSLPNVYQALDFLQDPAEGGGERVEACPRAAGSMPNVRLDRDDGCSDDGDDDENGGERPLSAMEDMRMSLIKEMLLHPAFSNSQL